MYKYIRFLPYTLLLSILYLSSGERKLLAQSPINVEIKTLSSIDVCGSKQFQIYIQTNEIYASDSIVGYDLFIGYNAEKIQFDQLLAANTISSQLQNAGSDASLSINKLVSGEIWISGAFLADSKFLKGKQPLIAVAGKYLKNCSDTNLITILQFSPAYYNFKDPPEIKTQNLVLNAEVAESGRIAAVQVEKDTIAVTYMEDIGVLPIYFQNDDISRTKYIECNIKFTKKDLIKLSKIESVQSNLKIDSMFVGADSVRLNISYHGIIDKLKPGLKIEFERSIKDSISIQAFIQLKILSECSCINDVLNDSVHIILHHPPVSVAEEILDIVNDKSLINYKLTNENISIQANEGYISHVSIYNIIGQKLENIENLHTSIEIPTRDLSGINLIEILVSYKSRTKKMLITYIK